MEDVKELEIAKKRLKNAGYKVVLSETNYTKDRYMCADKALCVKTLTEFFNNKNILYNEKNYNGYRHIVKNNVCCYARR